MPGEIGGIEQNTGRNTWRSPASSTAWCLNTLAEWGYTRCRVERIAAMRTSEPAND